MSKKVIIGSSVLVGLGGYTSSVGSLKKYEDGSYRQVFGALNAFNDRYEFYVGTPEVTRMFQDGSDLMNRIKDGECFTETQHPTFLPNETDEEFLERILTTDKSLVNSQILDIELLDTEHVEYERYGSVKLIRARFLPCGPGKDSLIAKLDDVAANNYFSIRSRVDRLPNSDGVTINTITNPYTFDSVGYNGIKYANKRVTQLLGLEGTPELPNFDDGRVEVDLSYSKNAIEVLMNKLIGSANRHGLNTTTGKRYLDIINNLECKVCNLHKNKAPIGLNALDDW